MAKKPALGRGLDMIFTDNTPENRENSVLRLRVSMVEPKSDQPRKDFDGEALSQLADSIAQNGVIQPIIVRDTGLGTYQIIAGERRWRAAKMAGLTEIPAILMEADDLKVAEVAIIENVQRENLNAYEEAEAYRALVESFDLTQEEVSKKIGKSRSAVANTMRLLDLPDDVLQMLRRGALSAGHARALLGAKNKEDIVPLAEKIVAKNLSVRDAEALVKAANKPKKEEADEGDEEVHVDYVAELEKKVRDLSGRYCKIQTKGKKKTVTVEYGGEGDLEALLSAICGEKITEE